MAVLNKVDLAAAPVAVRSGSRSRASRWSRRRRPRAGASADLRRAILLAAPAEALEARRIVGDLVSEGDLVVLVVPIDKEAPKGRLILPQVQTIRDLLDADAFCLVVKERELRGRARAALGAPEPRRDRLAGLPEGRRPTRRPGRPLTSFSILFARYQGDLPTMVRGTLAVERLKRGDRVLVAESCTHHPVGEDIGRVKIPRWLRQYTGLPLEFDHVAGRDFPEDLGRWALVVHCGNCMGNRKEMLSRLLQLPGGGRPGHELRPDDRVLARDLRAGARAVSRRRSRPRDRRGGSRARESRLSGRPRDDAEGALPRLLRLRAGVPGQGDPDLGAAGGGDRGTVHRLRQLRQGLQPGGQAGGELDRPGRGAARRRRRPSPPASPRASRPSSPRSRPPRLVGALRALGFSLRPGGRLRRGPRRPPLPRAPRRARPRAATSRTTCPAVVSYVERYHPRLVEVARARRLPDGRDGAGRPAAPRTGPRRRLHRPVHRQEGGGPLARRRPRRRRGPHVPGAAGDVAAPWDRPRARGARRSSIRRGPGSGTIFPVSRGMLQAAGVHGRPDARRGRLGGRPERLRRGDQASSSRATSTGRRGSSSSSAATAASWARA